MRPVFSVFSFHGDSPFLEILVEQAAEKMPQTNNEWVDLFYRLAEERVV